MCLFVWTQPLEGAYAKICSKGKAQKETLQGEMKDWLIQPKIEKYK